MICSFGTEAPWAAGAEGLDLLLRGDDGSGMRSSGGWWMVGRRGRGAAPVDGWLGAAAAVVDAWEWRRRWMLGGGGGLRW